MHPTSPDVRSHNVNSASIKREKKMKFPPSRLSPEGISLRLNGVVNYLAACLAATHDEQRDDANDKQGPERRLVTRVEKLTEANGRRHDRAHVRLVA